MGLFTLAAAFSVPPDYLVACDISVRHHSGDFVFHSAPIHGLKRKTELFIHSGKRLLLQGLTNRQIPVHWPILLVSYQPGDKTNLGILLDSAADLSGKRTPISFGYFPYCFLELGRHIYPHSKLDDPEALALRLSAIGQELRLISSSIRTQTHLPHTSGNQFQCSLERPKQIKIRRNVPVPKFAQHHNTLFRPIDVQRLIGLVFLITIQSL